MAPTLVNTTIETVIISAKIGAMPIVPGVAVFYGWSVAWIVATRVTAWKAVVFTRFCTKRIKCSIFQTQRSLVIEHWSCYLLNKQIMDRTYWTLTHSVWLQLLFQQPWYSRGRCLKRLLYLFFNGFGFLISSISSFVSFLVLRLPSLSVWPRILWF